MQRWQSVLLDLLKHRYFHWVQRTERTGTGKIIRDFQTKTASRMSIDDLNHKIIASRVLVRSILVIRMFAIKNRNFPTSFPALVYTLLFVLPCKNTVYTNKRCVLWFLIFDFVISFHPLEIKRVLRELHNCPNQPQKYVVDNKNKIALSFRKTKNRVLSLHEIVVHNNCL